MCSVDPDVAERARAVAETEALVRVPTVCAATGARREVLLLGRLEADRLAWVARRLEDALDARIVAALAAVAMCECDIARLTGAERTEVLARLARLEAQEVLAARWVEGIRSFAALERAVMELLVDFASQLR